MHVDAWQQDWLINNYCDSEMFGSQAVVRVVKELPPGASEGEAILSGDSRPTDGKYCSFYVKVRFDPKSGAATVLEGEFCDRDARKADIDWVVPVFQNEHLLLER